MHFSTGNTSLTCSVEEVSVLSCLCLVRQANTQAQPPCCIPIILVALYLQEGWYVILAHS